MSLRGRDVWLPSLILLSTSACVSQSAETESAAPKVEVHGAESGAEFSAADAPEAIARAREFATQGRIDGALAVLTLAESRFPESAAALRLERARVLNAGGMPESSLAQLAEVLGVTREIGDDTTHRQALALQGTIEASLSRLVEAERDLRLALSTRDDWPGASEATADLGVVLLRSGDRPEGIEMLKRARSRFLTEGDLDAVATIERNLVRVGVATEPD